MGKNTLIVGVATAVVVIGCGAGGAIYAVNASSSDSTPSKATANYELKKEKAKLNGWNQKDGSWYYYKDDKVKTGWVQDSGSWYYCDDSGKMKLNWIQDKSKWYYLGSDGKLRTGWIKDNDKWYYMNNDGTMAVNTTVDGNYLNQNGVIEETPKSQPKQSDDNSNKNLSIEEARNLIFKNIDTKDRNLLINGDANFLTSVTPNTNDDKAQKIYNYLGVKENMYEFQGLHSTFFVCQVTGTTYIVDPGETGKMGCGIYRIKDEHRAETWRIGGWHDNSHVSHTYNGEDWMTI